MKKAIKKTTKKTKEKMCPNCKTKLKLIHGMHRGQFQVCYCCRNCIKTYSK